MSRARSLDDFGEEMRVKDVAAYLGVSPCRIYQLDRAGALDFAAIKPCLGKKSYARERFRERLNGTLHGLSFTRRRMRRAG